MTDAPGPRTPSAAGALAALEAAARILAEARSVLVIDWPSRDVPASLALAGYMVFVKGDDAGQFAERPVAVDEVHALRLAAQRP